MHSFPTGLWYSFLRCSFLCYSLFYIFILTYLSTSITYAKVQPVPTPSYTSSMKVISKGNLVNPSQNQIKTVLVKTEDVSPNTQKITFSLNNGSGVLGYNFEIAFIANTTSIVEGSFTQLLPDSPFIKLNQITGIWKVEVSSLTQVQEIAPIDLFSIHVQRKDGISTDTPIRIFFTDKTNINNGAFTLQAELPIVLFQNTVPPTNTPTSPPVNNTNTPVANPSNTPILASPNSRLIMVETESISENISQITVGIENIEGVSSFQFEFDYDDTLVKLVDRSVVQLLPNSPTGFGLAIDGFLRFIATSPNTIATSGFQEMFSFQIERLSTTPLDQPIELFITDSSRVNDGFVDIHYNPVVPLFQTPQQNPTQPIPTSTPGIFPTATPTHTNIPTVTPTPVARNIMVTVDEVSSTLRKVIVGIDNAFDLSVLQFGFTFDPQIVTYVENSYEGLLFPESALVNQETSGNIRFIAASGIPSTQTGQHNLFSFLMERTTVPSATPVLLEVAPNTSINANEFPLTIPSLIILFESGDVLPVSSPTNTPLVIPTATPVVPNFSTRKLSIDVTPLTDSVDQVTVSIDDFRDITEYEFEFLFDQTFVMPISQSVEDFLFVNAPGSHGITGSRVFSHKRKAASTAELSGSNVMFTFQIQRTNRGQAGILVEIQIHTAKLNNGTIALEFDPSIILFQRDPNVTLTVTPSITPTHTAIAVPTPTHTPQALPTSTPTPFDPNARAVSVKIEDISDTEQIITVGIDDALDIFGYLFEFHYDPSQVEFVENSYESIIFSNAFDVVQAGDGKIILITSDLFPSTSGARDLFSFHMMKKVSVSTQAIELKFSDRTSVNDTAIPIQYDPIINLFDEDDGSNGQTDNTLLKVYEFNQAEYISNWKFIPGGFTGAEPGVLVPEFNLRRVIPSSSDNAGLTIIVNPGQVALIHTNETVDSGGSPVLFRLTARSVSDNGALALAALQGSLINGDGLDGSIATNIPADTNRIMDSEGRILLLYQPGSETKFTPVIQLASTSNDFHETVFLDKLEIFKLDDELFQY